MNSYQPLPLEQSIQTDMTGSKPGQVKTISKRINTALEAVDIFQKFNQSLSVKNMMLLETTEIGSRSTANKQSKSILMLQAALRIECNGQEVKLNALTINGNHALKQITSQLKLAKLDINSGTHKNGLQTLLVSYPLIHESMDEDSKLKRLSPIDILTSIKDSFESLHNNEYSIFLMGLFSYDLIAIYEDLPAVTESKNTCPDFVFYLAESLLVVDHQQNNKRYYCNHFTPSLVSDEEQQKTYFELSRSFEQFEKQLNQPKNDRLLSVNGARVDNHFSVDISDTDYQKLVIHLKKNIVDGDVFQVVPSRTFSLACTSPIESYKSLKQTNPSPYLFYMQDQDFTLFGASPESALKYTKATNLVELYPIAGTRPRGKNNKCEIDPDLDIRIEAELKLDTKEISEHMMLLDLARNDIARISKPGSISVTKLLEVDRYSQVMHLVSNVQGELRSDLDALHAYQACMNMGTLTGAPKLKATELLRKVEGTRRGSYGGAVGYINANGDMDTCIVIRSAFCQHGMAHIQAGAGIVYDSIPALEAQETSNKAMAVINAIQISNAQLSGGPK